MEECTKSLEFVESHWPRSTCRPSSWASFLWKCVGPLRSLHAGGQTREASQQLLQRYEAVYVKLMVMEKSAPIDVMGEVISTLTSCVLTHGITCLNGCKYNLAVNLSPQIQNVVISIDDINKLLYLQEFWSRTTKQILQQKGKLNINLCLRILANLSRSWVYTMSSVPTIIFDLDLFVLLLGDKAATIDSTVCQSIITGIFQWISFRMNHFVSRIGMDTIDSKTMRRFEAVNSLILQVLTLIRKMSVDVTVSYNIVAEITDVLRECVVTHRLLLIKSNLSAKENLSSVIISFVVTLLEALKGANDSSNFPSTGFLLQCCIDLTTHNLVLHLLLDSYQSFNGVYLQWLESCNIVPTVTTVTAGDCMSTDSGSKSQSINKSSKRVKVANGYIESDASLSAGDASTAEELTPFVSRLNASMNVAFQVALQHAHVLREVQELTVQVLIEPNSLLQSVAKSPAELLIQKCSGLFLVIEFIGAIYCQEKKRKKCRTNLGKVETVIANIYKSIIRQLITPGAIHSGGENKTLGSWLALYSVNRLLSLDSSYITHLFSIDPGLVNDILSCTRAAALTNVDHPQGSKSIKYMWFKLLTLMQYHIAPSTTSTQEISSITAISSQLQYLGVEHMLQGIKAAIDNLCDLVDNKAKVEKDDVMKIAQYISDIYFLLQLAAAKVDSTSLAMDSYWILLIKALGNMAMITTSLLLLGLQRSMDKHCIEEIKFPFFHLLGFKEFTTSVIDVGVVEQWLLKVYLFVSIGKWQKANFINSVESEHALASKIAAKVFGSFSCTWNAVKGGIESAFQSSTESKLWPVADIIIGTLLPCRLLSGAMDASCLFDITLQSKIRSVSNHLDGCILSQVVKLNNIVHEFGNLRLYNIKLLHSHFMCISMLDRFCQEGVVGEDPQSCVSQLSNLGAYIASSCDDYINCTNKRNLFIEVTSIARLVRVCAIINPYASIWALGILVKLFAVINNNNNLDQECLVDEVNLNILSALFGWLRASSVLEVLLVNHLPCIVENIVIPCLKNPKIPHQTFKVALNYLLVDINDEMEETQRKYGIDIVYKLAKPFVLSFIFTSNSGKVIANRIKDDEDVICTFEDLFYSPHFVMVIYHILMSDMAQRFSDAELIQGQLFHIMLRGATLYDYKLNRTDEFIQHGIQRLLYPLIWDLGSIDERKACALKSLKVACTLYRAKCWAVSDQRFSMDTFDITSNFSADYNENVAHVLPSHFLWLVSQFFPFEWNNLNQNYQLQSVKALKEMVSLIKQGDINKFLPKIMSVLNGILVSKYALVRYISISLTDILCRHLATEVLLQNISALIAGLFPFIEDNEPLRQKYSHSLNRLTIPLDEYRLSKLFDKSLKPLVQLFGLACGISRNVQEIVEIIFLNEIEEKIEILSKVDTVALINDIFSGKSLDIKRVSHAIAYIPSVKGLEGVIDTHSKEIQSLSLDQSLKLLCQMLKHESSNVRVLVLNRVFTFISDKRNKIYSAVTTFSSSNMSADSAISSLLQQLLYLCVHDSNSDVVDACAKCLGSLGAIDPARVNIFLPSSHKLLTYENNAMLKPHEMSVVSVGIYLLEHHLVPSLKSNRTVNNQSLVKHHDRIGYSIQHVLRLLASLVTENTSFVESSTFLAFPESLKAMLVSKSIFDVTEAFWVTKYSIDDNLKFIPKVIFNARHIRSYQRWLAAWTRSLLAIAKGQFVSLFTVCRGVLRFRADLCQFMLPFLIVDVLSNDSDGKLGALIQNEIMCVLAVGDNDNSSSVGEDDMTMGVEAEGKVDHTAIQIIFILLDTLSLWLGKIPKDLQKSSSSDSKNSFARIWEKAHVPLQKLMDSISKMSLAHAAFCIKAYARSLRYFEIYLRDKHRENRLKQKDKSLSNKAHTSTGTVSIDGVRNDGASGELPMLNRKQLNLLTQIFSYLDDPDALLGVQVLRQVQSIRSTTWDRILELQHTDDWLGALIEYGSLASNGIVTVNDTTTNVMGSRSKRARLDVLANGRDNDLRLKDKSLLDVERGRLRCLIELDQLEASINQVNGIVSSFPEVSQAVLPLGIEAAWRLTNWDTLNSFLNTLEDYNTVNNTASRHSLVHGTNSSRFIEDDFQVKIGKLFHSIIRNNRESFGIIIKEARKESMISLAAASMESYGRAYPFLIYLHILHEMEMGYDLMALTGERRKDYVNTLQLQWDERLNMMSTKQSSVLAIRRSLLAAAKEQKMIAQNWLGLCKSMCQFGRLDAAKIALRNAELSGLSPSTLLLQEAELLKQSGQINKALHLLEPVEPNISGIISYIRANKRLPDAFKDADTRAEFSEKLLLVTKMMFDSRQKIGKTIEERYKCVLQLTEFKRKEESTELTLPRDSPFFELARYHEHLFHEAKSREASGKGSISVGEFTYHNHILLALKYYGSCLACVSQNKYITQALPRMLTLWFSYTSQRDTDNALLRGIGGNRSINAVEKESIQELRVGQREVNEQMRNNEKKIDTSVWYYCMPHLASRVGHSNADTVNIIQSILAKVLASFPHQGVWHIVGLLHSLNSDKDRRRIGVDLIKQAFKELMQRKREKDASMIQEAPQFFAAIVDLAYLVPKDKERRLKWTATRGMNLKKFIIPSQQMLRVPMKLSDDKGVEKHQHDDSSYIPSEHAHIQAFHEEVDIAISKAKPKTLTLTTTAGKIVKFLLKLEKNGDLRKDNRLMEFNTVVNRLLNEDPEGRRRLLQLRTFSVICLNEECGLLEWVDNTSCVRHLIQESHSYWPAGVYPPIDFKQIYKPFTEMQTLHQNDVEGMMKEYRSLISDVYRPCFHRWFIENFPDPTDWLDARVCFTRSVAVWSAVGHVVGLGDRHSENILLDVTKGECVQVDFDCLFDKGLTLLRPEIVPFRLTPNFVDAMGLTGVEGTFRSTMEVCMRLLRDNKETLLSVLEPFIRDPTVQWGRTGRAQRAESVENKEKHAPGVFQDNENADAKEALNKVSERLSGIYNLTHPHAARIKDAYLKRKASITVGVGASKDETLPLSVHGQVQRLIFEATAEENLVQMYIGWQPWS